MFPVKFTKSGGKTIIGAVSTLGKPIYLPSADMLSTVLQKIELRYNKLLKEVERGCDLIDAIDAFLRDVSGLAIIGSGFIECLASDLRLSRSQIRKAVLSTNYAKNLLSIIKKNQYARKKQDPITYAEACRQLVDLFGLKSTRKILKRTNISLKEDTLRKLCKVAVMPCNVKNAVREGKIPLTLAFQLPFLNEEDFEEVLKRISGLSRAEAIKQLRKMVKKE